VACGNLNECAGFSVQVSSRCPRESAVADGNWLTDAMRQFHGDEMTTPAVQHGYYSRSPSALEIRARKVSRLMRKLRVIAPWIEPSDEPVAKAYCELEIISASIFAALTKLGPLNGKADARQLVDVHRKLRLTALAYARELGLSPASRMAIKANGTRSAFDLPAEMLKNVTDIGESRAAERAERAKESKDDG
jgi:hypothetical protein